MTPIDLHIAHHLRCARVAQGLAQRQLATILNCSLGKVQHMERAETRIPVSDLWRLSCVFDLPISYFFANFNQVEK